MKKSTSDSTFGDTQQRQVPIKSAFQLFNSRNSSQRQNRTNSSKNSVSFGQMSQPFPTQARQPPQKQNISCLQQLQMSVANLQIPKLEMQSPVPNLVQSPSHHTGSHCFSLDRHVAMSPLPQSCKESSNRNPFQTLSRESNHLLCNSSLKNSPLFHQTVPQEQKENQNTPFLKSPGAGQSNEENIYLNVILVDQFKAVFKQLDPQKKGYVKLKDLSAVVNCIQNVAQRDALIKFFVGFVKQTNKHYISKVSFLTNAVNAYLHKKYDFHLFISEKSFQMKPVPRAEPQPQVLAKPSPNPLQEYASKEEIAPFKENYIKEQRETPHQEQQHNNNDAVNLNAMVDFHREHYAKRQNPVIQPQAKHSADEMNSLFYKHFSGQVSKSNQLSKQNELYIQHLLNQSQAYQQQKKMVTSSMAKSSKENLLQSPQFYNTHTRKPSTAKTMKSSRTTLKSEKLKPPMNLKKAINNNFPLKQRTANTHRNQYKLQPTSNTTNSQKTNTLYSVSDILTQSTFDSRRGKSSRREK